MDFGELLDDFMTEAGLDSRPVVEDGACHLTVKGRDIGFMEADGGRRMVVWTVVSQCPVDRREAFLILLLRANFMNRMLPNGAFSLSDDDNVYAHVVLPLPVYDREEFHSVLRTLLEAVEQWERLAEGYAQVVRPLPPDGKDGNQEDWGLENIGMRV